MATLTDRLEKLKSKRDKAQRDLDRAEGSFQNGMERLEKEHCLTSLKEADAEIETLLDTEDEQRKLLEDQISELEAETDDESE